MLGETKLPLNDNKANQEEKEKKHETIQKSELEEKLKRYDHVLISHPKNRDFLLGKGAILITLNRYEEALKIYNFVVELCQTSFIHTKTILITHSKFYSDRTPRNLLDYALARKDESSHTSNYADALCHRAETLLSLNRYWEALSDCQYSLQLCPHSSRALFILAQVYINLGKPQEALLHCDAALKLAPDTPMLMQSSREIIHLLIVQINRNDSDLISITLGKHYRLSPEEEKLLRVAIEANFFILSVETNECVSTKTNEIIQEYLIRNFRRKHEAPPSYEETIKKDMDALSETKRIVSPPSLSLSFNLSSDSSQISYDIPEQNIRIKAFVEPLSPALPSLSSSSSSSSSSSLSSSITVTEDLLPPTQRCVIS